MQLKEKEGRSPKRHSRGTVVLSGSNTKSQERRTGQEEADTDGKAGSLRRRKELKKT